jgi:TetR/AcrR family transcriptional regulator, repressor of fatR-cypB operon
MARERKFSEDDLFKAVERVLLTSGYDGLNFGLLAEQLHVSRGALYKYYKNKEDLVLEYMVHKMHIFFRELKEMEKHESFEHKFDYLFHIMFKHSAIVQILAMAHQNPFDKNERMIRNKDKMTEYHLNIYAQLDSFIKFGKQEGIIKDEFPNSLLLGMMFQTIVIPNHFGVPEEEWVTSIKNIIQKGMFI